MADTTTIEGVIRQQLTRLRAREKAIVKKLHELEAELTKNKQLEAQFDHALAIATAQPVTAKTCSKCRVEKPVSEFNRMSASKDGYTAACKECKKRAK